MLHIVVSSIHTCIVKYLTIFNHTPFTDNSCSTRQMDSSGFLAMGTAVVVGAGSDIGYTVSSYLYNSGYDVIPVEDYLSLEVHPTREKWLNIHSLWKAELPVKFIDLSDDSVLEGLLWRDGFVTVVYVVPTLVEGLAEGGLHSPPKYTQLLDNYLRLIHTLLCRLGTVRLLLIVPPQPHASSNGGSVIVREMVQLYKLLLKSYISNNAKFKAEVIQVLQCSSSCDSIAQLAMMIRSLKKGSAFERTIRLPSLRKRRTNGLKNVIFTTYFTSKSFKAQSSVDSFQYMKGFLMTAKQFDVDIVIIHDGASPEFQARLREFNDRIDLIQYNGDFHGRSINDGRFFIMYEYMLNNPNIGSIVLQDLRDGIFLLDPFKVMSTMGDTRLYLGVDIPFFTRMRKGYKGCEKKLLTLYDSRRLYPEFNAGTLGGSWEVVLSYLQLMIRSFEEIFPSEKNCNMDAFDFVAHRYFYDIMYYGNPFQGHLQTQLSTPNGIAIRHKDTFYDK